jgi:hypothetical protein
MWMRSRSGVQAGVDVPDIGDRIEPAGLHRDGLQDILAEVGRQRIAQLVGDHALDGLQPFGRRWARRCALKQIAICRRAGRARLAGIRVLSPSRAASAALQVARCRQVGAMAAGSGKAGGAEGGVGSLTRRAGGFPDSVSPARARRSRPSSSDIWPISSSCTRCGELVGLVSNCDSTS